MSKEGGIFIPEVIAKSKSSDFFDNENQIFINRITEQTEPHMHEHDFIEIAYVASGRGMHRIGQNEYPVSKGDLFIINYDVPHEFFRNPNNPEEILIVYNCLFTPGFIDPALMNSRNFYDLTLHFLFKSIFPEAEYKSDIHLIERDTCEIEGIYEKMLREYSNKEKGYAQILRAYTIELLIKIFRLYGQKDEIKRSVESKRNEIIGNVEKYIRENSQKDLSLDELASFAFISANYLSRLFKECTGINIVNYIQNTRVENACKLLKNSNKTILEIASEVGYKDIKHFNQIFKRITGKTPGEYRRY